MTDAEETKRLLTIRLMLNRAVEMLDNIQPSDARQNQQLTIEWSKAVAAVAQAVYAGRGRL